MLIITPLYVGLLGFMLLFLSFRVSLVRGQHGIRLGDQGNVELLRAMRVQANFIEYVPMLVILMGILEVTGLSAYLLHGFGIVLVLARLLHFIGLSTEQGPVAARVLGTVLTWVLLLTLSALAVLYASLAFLNA